MVVIYAEKSSLAKNIAKALNAGNRIADPNEPMIGHWEFKFKGEDAILCYGSGHLLQTVHAREYGEQYKNWDLEKYPCIPDKLKIAIKPTTEYCYKVVSEFISNADWLINATDPDREGELIFGYIYQLLKCSLPWKRVLIDDFNKIHQAFNNLKSSDEALPLQNAGRARDFSDWILGINLTIAATKKYGSKENLFSVGRVQTPTLALIVNREKEILNHVKKPYFKLISKFTNNKKSFIAEYSGDNFAEKTTADKLLCSCKNKQGIIKKIETKEKKELVPLLYNATQLKIVTNKTFDWDLKHTDKIMQSLYEKGYMTYPRSSSEHLPESMTVDATNTITQLFNLPEYIPFKLEQDKWQPYSKRHFDDSKVGSHTAIIPTSKVPTALSSLGEDEAKLYDLLAKSLIRVIYPEANLQKSTVYIDVNGNEFKATGTTINSAGWFNVDSMPKGLKTLPEIINDELYDGQYKIIEETTKPPRRYTQATLIGTMELAGKNMEDEEARTIMKLHKMGLGTEATRTAIVQQLIRQEYIKNKGKSLIPTEKGIFLIDNFPINEIKSPEMTGDLEKKLNDIALGKYPYEEYLEIIKKKAKDWYNTLANTTCQKFVSETEKLFVCPSCGKPLRFVKFGLGCTGYKDGCNFTLNNNICGKKITESQMLSLIKSGKTNIIKNFTSKAGGKFDARLKLNPKTYKLEFEFPNKKGKK